MIKGGFIKIDRNIVNWRWYGDANTMRVFIHLLLTANYEDKPFERLIIQRGEVATSYEAIAKKLNLSVRNVRTALNHLKSTGEVTSKSYSKFQVITIVNYDSYQNSRQAKRQSGDSQVTGNCQSSDNNGRKIKKSTTYSKKDKEGADAQSALSGKVIEEPPPGVTFPEGITNMADYSKYLEE